MARLVPTATPDTASEIIPRLAGITRTQGDCTTLGDRALQAQWRLGDKSRLTLLANLGAAPVPLETFPEEEHLFATPEDGGQGASQEVLFPWSVVWFLESNEFGDRLSTYADILIATT